MRGAWRDQLRHFSLAHEITPSTYRQADWPLARRDKPQGLWVSVEGGEDVWGWSDWCRVESWDIGPNEHRVTLSDDARLVVIESADALRAFHEQFKTDDGGGIRWRDVALDHQGIVITPYQWQMRLDLEVGWYYSWDCASGCIWNADAIASTSFLGATAPRDPQRSGEPASERS